MDDHVSGFRNMPSLDLIRLIDCTYGKKELLERFVISSTPSHARLDISRGGLYIYQWFDSCL